ncbi:MAG: hypothetical protein ACLQFT_03335 [Steroidobacteraceae bacterium]
MWHVAVQATAPFGVTTAARRFTLDTAFAPVQVTSLVNFGPEVLQELSNIRPWSLVRTE